MGEVEDGTASVYILCHLQGFRISPEDALRLAGCTPHQENPLRLAGISPGSTKPRTGGHRSRTAESYFLAV